MSFSCTIFCPTRVNIGSCIFPCVLPRPIKLSSLAPHSSATTSARWPSAPVSPPPAGVAMAGWWWISRTAVKMSVFRQPQHQLPFESLTENFSYVTTRAQSLLISLWKCNCKYHSSPETEGSLVNFPACDCFLLEGGRTRCYIAEAAAEVSLFNFHFQLNSHKTDKDFCSKKVVLQLGLQEVDGRGLECSL